MGAGVDRRGAFLLQLLGVPAPPRNRDAGIATLTVLAVTACPKASNFHFPNCGTVDARNRWAHPQCITAAIVPDAWNTPPPALRQTLPPRLIL